jgi:hypothetical protein
MILRVKLTEKIYEYVYSVQDIFTSFNQYSV